jgi:hypothetical protein
VFVALVIAPLNDFPSMRFILLLGCVGEKANVVMNIKIEQRARFSPGFVDDKIVKCIVLCREGNEVEINRVNETYMRNNEVLLSHENEHMAAIHVLKSHLDIHQIVNIDTS